MSNFGFTSLRLVNPYHVAFREARSAVGASKVLENAVEFATVTEAIADCDLVVGTASLGNRELKLPVRRLEIGSRLIRKAGTTALLFGSEKFGLSNEDLSHCHWLMRIPTRDEHQSMNLGQAVALCLYELIRNPAAESRAPKQSDKAKAAELDRIADNLMEILKTSWYFNEKTAPSTRLKIRRLVRRMEIGTHDAEVWLGILRQIDWKLKTKE
jgi:tRNA/rRNA methyltransferase